MTAFPTTTKKLNEATWPRFCHRKMGFMAQMRLADDSPCDKCTQRKGNAKKLRSTHCRSQGNRQYSKNKQFTRTGMGNAFEKPGDQSGASKKHYPYKRGRF